jgi:homoserine kinase type II
MVDVHAVLANYPPDCRPTTVESLGSAGGMSSAQIWRIHSPRGEFALRRWPIEHPAPDQLRFIHTVLCHAATNGCDFLPVPATTRDGQTFIRHREHLWEFAPWMPGIASYESSPSREKLRAAMHALAKFHNAVADYAKPTVIGSSVGLNAIERHLARLGGVSPLRINQLARAVNDVPWPDLAPLARQFVAILTRTIPHAMAQLAPLSQVRPPLQPCLRDVWSDHILFTSSEVTGIIDFGAVDFDIPATDIARLLGSFAQLTVADIWTEGLAAYNEVRPISDTESRAAQALDSSGTILAGCNWIQWIYIDRRTFDDRLQIVERFRRILSRCGQIS